MRRAEYTAFLFAHIALFIVFVWFGALKFFDLSPANPLVADLLARTLPFMSFSLFCKLLGGYEVLIGILFIIPRMERIAILLLIPHMLVTILPLVLLPAVTWQAPFAPTMEGQYIIKNVVIIALAATVFADLDKRRLKA
ncbi:MAG TPA: hypothetical protein VIR98_00740 [Candidatus Paceibacterota bacterium]|jgi:Predicted membrane protein